MPGDRLFLAIFVRREQEARPRLSGASSARRPSLSLARVDDVERLEVLRDRDAEGAYFSVLLLPVGGALRQVADVADARGDVEVVAEVALDRPRLRRRPRRSRAVSACILGLDHESTLAASAQAAIFAAMAPFGPVPRCWALQPPLMNLLLRPKATGVENVPRGRIRPRLEPPLSNFDPWAVGLPIFPWRYLRFMAKEEPVVPLGPFIKAGGAFKVRRGSVTPLPSRRRSSRAGRPRGRDLPRGDAAQERNGEEARGPPAHRRSARRARRRRADPGGDQRDGRTAEARPCGSSTASRSGLTISTAATTARPHRRRPID